ncbi:MAG: hypothetical protein JRN15_09580 [Nitrososphaerota archaeon]|nr:hypothetical protein [Nitrososphaerota archaeon]
MSDGPSRNGVDDSHTRTVSLSEVPNGKEFEDYVAACYQLTGHYVEKNVTRRIFDAEDDKKSETAYPILELDAIVTIYNAGSMPITKLVEVKSGEWGCPDIFKIRGWMDYLDHFDVKEGVLITANKRPKQQAYEKVGRELDVRVCSMNNAEFNLKTFVEIMGYSIVVDNEKEDMVEKWRYAYWLERNMIQMMKTPLRADPRYKRKRSIDEYYATISYDSFFAETVLDKLLELYAAFQKFPHITAKAGNEMIGNSFEDECGTIPREVFGRSFYKCEYNDIQISTFVEHKARLSIMKSAVDYTLSEANGKKTGMDKDSEFSFDSLPENFRNALTRLADQPYFHLYPAFWQWFLWVFGGFILLDYEKQEYESLSRFTGIPVDEIHRALAAYDVLFPIEAGSWLGRWSNYSNISQMKMFSLPFSGVGVNTRINLYTRTQNFDDLELSMDRTQGDLSKWNNLCIDVLCKDNYVA